MNNLSSDDLEKLSQGDLTKEQFLSPRYGMSVRFSEADMVDFAKFVTEEKWKYDFSEKRDVRLVEMLFYWQEGKNKSLSK